MGFFESPVRIEAKVFASLPAHLRKNGHPSSWIDANHPGSDLGCFLEGQRSIGTPDGRLLLPAVPCGRARLLIGKPGGNFFLLVDTVEQTGPPAVMLSTSEVAFIAGTASDQTVVIASARDGRLVRSLQG